MLCRIYIVVPSVVTQSVVMHIIVAPLEEVIDEKTGYGWSLELYGRGGGDWLVGPVLY